jgi:hypothetical protein
MTCARLERGDVLDGTSRIDPGLRDQRDGDAAAGGEQAQHDENGFDCHGRVPPVPTDDAERTLFDARSWLELAQAASGYPSLKLAMVRSVRECRVRSALRRNTQVFERTPGQPVGVAYAGSGAKDNALCDELLNYGRLTGVVQVTPCLVKGQAHDVKHLGIE